MNPSMTDEQRAARRTYMRAYYHANKEKYRGYDRKSAEERAAYNHAYHQANRARIQEQGKAWRKANHDAYIAGQHAYRAANLDKVREAQRKYYHATKETRKEVMRENSFKQNRKRPALLLARQEAALGRKKPDVCDACGGSDGGIVFDHCHSAMFPRGWLCDRCNVALGCIRDSPDRLRKLISYLKRNKTGVTPDFMIAGKFASLYRHPGSRRHVVVKDENGHSLTRIG